LRGSSSWRRRQPGYRHYLVIAAIAEIAVRARVPTRRGAVLACLPSLALLAAAAAGVFVGDLTADGRGSPLFLYFGVALWASWAALVLSTALVSRTRWNRLAYNGTIDSSERWAAGIRLIGV
jgi:hypothetical protein